MRSRINAHTVLALAAVAILGFAASSAASDFCSPCVRPVAVQTVAVQAPLYCNVCPSPALARTNLPGWYSNDYDYHTTAQYATGITYAIPTVNGFIESDHIPLTNPVDQYYVTHSIVNGQVVDDSAGAMASVSDQLKMDKLDDTVRTAQAQMHEAFRRMDTAQTQMDRASETMQSAQTQIAQLDRNLQPDQASQPRVAQLDRNLRGVETSRTVRSRVNAAGDFASTQSQIAQADRSIQTGQTGSMVENARTQAIQSMNDARGELTEARQQLRTTQEDLARTIEQYQNVQNPVDVSMKETDDAWKDIMDRQDLTAVPQMREAPLELPPVGR